MAADRELAGRLLEICPSLRGAARENREFLARAVTWAARQGIRRFADLGTGMPAHPSAGDAARAITPTARIVYVDNDLRVTDELDAMLGDGGGQAVVRADIRAPADVLGDPALRTVIDLAQPVCVVFGLVLSLMPARQARETVAGYAATLAPGSVLAISCGRCDDKALWQELRAAYTAADAYNHSPRQVRGFLAGLELVPPGVVAAASWRGGWRDVPTAPQRPAHVLSGVARRR